MPSTTILSGMNGSITFGDFIAQLSVQVSDKSLGYSDSLFKNPIISPVSPDIPQPKHLNTKIACIEEPIKVIFTHIIIISLSYPKTPGFEPLEGTKNDFGLLFNRFNRFNQGHPVQFTLVHDFDYVYNGTCAGAGTETMPKVPADKKAIEDAIRRTMGQTTPDSKVLFYFGGHGDDGAIIAGDGQPITGSELRSWISDAPHSSVPVTAVYDCCSSEGSLGLPYTYEATSDDIKMKRATLRKVSNPILQISVDKSWSNKFRGGYHGQLTWYFLRYLEKYSSDPSITSIVHFMKSRFELCGGQAPHISCSKKLGTEFPFF